MSSSVVVRSFLHLGVASTVLDLLQLESLPVSRSPSYVDIFSSVSSIAYFNVSLLVFGSALFKSSLLMQSPSQLNPSLTILNLVHMDSLLFPQSLACLGLGLLVLDHAHIDSSVLLQIPVCLGLSLTASDLLHMGSSLPPKSPLYLRVSFPVLAKLSATKTSVRSNRKR